MPNAKGRNGEADGKAAARNLGESAHKTPALPSNEWRLSCGCWNVHKRNSTTDDGRRQLQARVRRRGQHNGTRIIITPHRRTPPHLCCAPVCASRSRCARKNAHIRLDASILLLVRPTNHSGSGCPPGQVWPPPLMV